MVRTLYVLTSRCGCDMGGPSASFSLAEMQNEMGAAYASDLADAGDRAYADESHCGDMGAVIVTGADWIEWEITPIEVEIPE